MNGVKLTCKTCGGELELKENIAFCPYCGAKLVIDDGNRTFTQNYNYTYSNRDEAKIRENERKEAVRLKALDYLALNQKMGWKFVAIAYSAIAVIIILIILGFSLNSCVSKAQGKIRAGDYYDYTGENYTAVVAQFEAMGFENVVAIDLNDTGSGGEEDGKVKSVSINGDDNFSSSNYFHPTDKVIITYH